MFQYLPVNARSVSFSRSTAYCSGVSVRFHSSSVFFIGAPSVAVAPPAVRSPEAALPEVEFGVLGGPLRGCEQAARRSQSALRTVVRMGPEYGLPTRACDRDS